MRLEKASFGPVLRAARERRGVSFVQIAAETKLGVELWADLEDNNLTRWPKRIYARSYVRDYALRVGLDADDVVNDFCRLFPEWGDRRAEGVIRGQADIIDHDLSWQDLPTKERRRATDRPARSPLFGPARTRIVAAAIDALAVVAVGYLAVLLRAPFWPSLAMAAMAYSAVVSLVATKAFGLIAAEWLFRLAAAMPEARRRLVSSRVSPS